MAIHEQQAIPVVDIRPFLIGSLEEKQKVAREAGRACEAIGFLAITGHGVSTDLIEKTYVLARESFDLPIADKLKVRMTPAGLAELLQRLGLHLPQQSRIIENAVENVVQKTGV